MDVDEDIIVREMNEEDAEKLDLLMEKPAGIQSIYKQIFEEYRNKGLANYLMDKLEEQAAQRSELCGIGVGLAEPYETAQNLLAERGYEPDGKGVFYIEPEAVHDELEVDDYQALMMIKKVK